MRFRNLNAKGWLAIYILFTASIADAKELTTMTLGSQGHPTLRLVVEAPPLPTATPDPSYTDPKIFEKQALEISNEYREQHSAKPLVWNNTLAEYAKNWSEACIWKHSGGYGENIAGGFQNLSGAIRAWGDERELYDFDLPTGFDEKTGHFTQLVWKASRQMGCAAFNCGYQYDRKKVVNDSPEKDGNGTTGLVKREGKGEDGPRRAQGWYLVCEYQPAGNIYSNGTKLFKKNVMPRKVSKTSKTSTSTSTSATATATAATGEHSPETGGAFKAGFGRMMLFMGMACAGLGL